MNARNEFETATNTIEDTLVVEELSDADLMAINGGSAGTAVDDLLGSAGAAVTGAGLPLVGNLLTVLATFGK